MMKMDFGPMGEIATGNPLSPPRERSLWFARREILVLLLGLLIAVGYAGVRLWSEGIACVPALLSISLPCLAAGGAWCSRARLGKGDGRIWVALATGMTLWAGAGFYSLPWMRPVPPGVSPAAGALAIAANVAWLYTLFAMRRDITIVPRIAAGLEVVLIAGCGLTLAAYFILAPGSGGGNAPLLLLWAVSTLLLFAALVGFRYLATGPLSRTQVLTLLGLLAAAIGQGWQLKFAAHAQTLDDLPLAGAQMGTAVLFGAAAYWALWPPTARPRTNRWENVAPWLPIACLLAVIGLPIWSYSQSGALDPNLAIGVFVCLALAVLRLGFSLGENHQLRQERARLLWQNQEYIRLAISDPLTGLLNKGYFDYRLKIEWERARIEQHALTLIALDLDNFKQVNDRYGHAAGDALLKEIGEVLRNGIRSVDTACRCGGDEFVLILPRTTAEQGAILAERLRASIARVVARRGLGTVVATSAGVATFPDMTQALKELPHLADLALYQSKQQGKNCTSVYKPAA